MYKQTQKLFLFVLFLFSIFVVTGCTQSDSKIEEIYNQIFVNENLAAVESDLSFPKSIEDVDINYVSNKPDVISNEGKVVRQSEDVIVEITITLKQGKNEVIKKVTMTVLKKVDKITDVFTNLFKDIDLEKVISDLSFPTLVGGVSITYNSTNTSIISNDGKVKRGVTDNTVSVSITLTLGSEVLNKVIEITVLKESSLLLEEVYNKLFTNVDISMVNSNLNFSTLIDGVSIRYESTNINVVANDGKITRGKTDQTVLVNLTLTLGSEVLNKVIEITVLKDNSLIIDEAFNKLFMDVDLTKVTTDLTFLTVSNGVSISYQSTNTNIVSNDGKVTRGATDQTVTVNLTLTYENEVIKKTISIIVLKDNNLFINQVYNSLFSAIDLSKVKDNLNFITSKEGVNINYVSNNLLVVNNDGIITRSNEDKQVKITISLTYEGISVNKELLITVLKVETYPIINGISASLDQTVTVQGIVVGKVGGNYYIHDGNNGIYLYLLGSGYNIGDEIKVTGVRAEFNGLIQLKNNKDIIKVNSNVKLPDAINIQNLSEINRQSTLYNINNLKVTRADTITSGKDVFIIVNDSNNKTMEIIISKHTDTANVNEIASKLGNIKIGDTISLTNIISGYYKNYQMQLFSANQISIKHIDDEVIVTDPIEPYYPKSEDMTFIKDELDEYLTSGLTPKGEANVLIIPINFTDYTISPADLARLQIAFFGTSEETGWESVKSYYDKSSYGKFNFNGQILNPFQTNKPSTYYANRFNDGIDADYDVIKAALEYYDPMIDYSIYDNDKDGYIDGLYFIYAAPTWYGNDTGSINDSDLWWAYVYQYYTEEYELYDGVEANYYLWAGIDFMDEAFTYTETTDEFIEINAATYIHETGHMLGLYDYYDYDEKVGPGGGLGGADMMDYTVGDHNSFSKIMLDWATPLVVSGKSTIVDINSFSTSGDVILVSTNWNNTYFDEYFLIELYTPTGLNEAHAGFNGLYSISGIRIFHVNAQLHPDQSQGELFLYDNSDTARKILKPIEADNNNSIENEWIAEDSDLFQIGDVFGKDTNYRLSSGALVNFNINILNLSNNSAQIEIIFN